MVNLTLLKRYVKDTGQYAEFKQRVYDFCKQRNFKNGLQELANCYNSNISLLQVIKFPGEDNNYLSSYKIYLYEQKKDEYIKRFTNLLKEKGAYEQFFNNVDEEFIKKELDDTNRTLINGDKQTLIFDNLTPDSFLMYAFYWRPTKQGHDFWEKMNNQWEKILRDEEKKENYF